MNQVINPKIKGWVKITQLKDNKVIYDNPNALVSNYLNILRRTLSGENNFKLDRIRIKNQGTELTSSPITQISYPVPNQVRYIALFEAPSFNGEFDEVNLYSDQGGLFSVIENLNLEKDANTALQIEWKLTFINQA